MKINILVNRDGNNLYFTLNKSQFEQLKKDVIKTHWDGTLIMNNGDTVKILPKKSQLNKT